ncbi:MAG: N-acetylmuramoyl-L-alanine amidase [Lachnospiraceae bacterium]|nr:N-acetylmuramoyl-L-alanine amidase [Lachnospiraceae bacterium]
MGKDKSSEIMISALAGLFVLSIVVLIWYHQGQTNSLKAEETPEVNYVMNGGSKLEIPTVPRKVKLVIDAGHGGNDNGSRCYGLNEKKLTLDITKGAKKYFDQDPRFEVTYTRTSDKFVNKVTRYEIANKLDADLFICIHINFDDEYSRGTETLYSKDRNKATVKNGISSKDLAKAMQKAAVEATGFNDRGLSNRPNLAVLGNTNMPACLIEYGFLNNGYENEKMKENSAYYGQKLYESLVAFCTEKGLLH